VNNFKETIRNGPVDALQRDNLSPYECFELFFDKTLLKYIANQSNKYIQNKFKDSNSILSKYFRDNMKKITQNGITVKTKIFARSKNGPFSLGSSCMQPFFSVFLLSINSIKNA